MPDAHPWTTVPHGGKTKDGSAVADDAPEDPWEKVLLKEAMCRSMGCREKPIKTKDCRRGEKCTVRLCCFVHPGEAKLPAPTTRTITNNRPVKSGNKKCRFGVGCYNPNCRFDHPPLPGGELLIHQAPLASQAPHPTPNPQDEFRQLVEKCNEDTHAVLGPPSVPPLITHVGTLAGEKKEAAPTHARRILPEPVVEEEEECSSFAALLARVQEDTEEERAGTFASLASLLGCDACVEKEDPTPPSALHSTHSEEEEPPEAFICPITQELMRDPVILDDGHTYEREAIETWLRRDKTSPKTNLPLDDHSIVIRNHAIRNMIEDWEEEKKKKRAPRPA